MEDDVNGYTRTRVRSMMAEERQGEDVVSEFLGQNPHLASWVESLQSQCETNKQWRARREFILRNMESFPTVQPGVASPSLDRLLSLSMVWANHIFLGCIYSQTIMKKITEMAEGIVVRDVPVKKTRDEIMGKGKRPAMCEIEAESSAKKPKPAANESESRAGGRASARPGAAAGAKAGLPPQAPAEHQPFFNRLYKAVAWKLVSAGGFGPNLDHFEILRACVESSKASLSCVFVPLKDIPDLPVSRTQKEGQVCELRCQTVYMGTGYGRDESSARAMASKEALKVFQGRKVTVKICRRRFRVGTSKTWCCWTNSRGTRVSPALDYPFQSEQPVGTLS